MVYNQSRIQRVHLENCSMKILLREHPYVCVYIYIYIFFFFFFGGGGLNLIIGKSNLSHKNEGWSIQHSTVKSVK